MTFTESPPLVVWPGAKVSQSTGYPLGTPPTGGRVRR